MVANYSLEMYRHEIDQWEPIIDEEVLEAFKSLEYPDELIIKRGKFSSRFRLVTEQMYEANVVFHVKLTARSEAAARQTIEQNLPFETSDTVIDFL